jgi:hypothetical protein
LAVHAFLVLIRPINDPDIWWHLRTGQYICQNLSIPRTDIYSFTVFGQPWTAHEWLSEVVMYGTFQAAGWIGLIVLSSFVTAAIFVYVAYRVDAPPQIVLLVTVGVQAASLVVLRDPRPRLATLLFSAVFFVELREYVGGRRSFVWLLPIVTVCWVNLHAGYVLGLTFVFIACFVLVVEGKWKQLRHLVLILALCLLAISINPNGIRMYTYPFETQFSAAQMSLITEWSAPDFKQTDTLPFLFLILAIVAVLGLSKKRTSWFDTASLLLACFLSLRSKRHVSVLSLVAVPIVAEHLWNWISSTSYGQEKIARGGREKVLPFILILLLVIAVHIPAILETIKGPLNLTEKPVRAVRLLKEQNLANNVFSTYEWNDYLIWAAPDRKVFIDGRADMYGDEFLTRFSRLYELGEDWEATFNRFAVNTVLLPRSSPLAVLIRQNPAWSEVYTDDLAVIFKRK